MTEVGLLGLWAHPALSAESPVPFSFASFIEFAGFSFALIAFCVTFRFFPPQISASLRYCDAALCEQKQQNVFSLSLKSKGFSFLFGLQSAPDIRGSYPNHVKDLQPYFNTSETAWIECCSAFLGETQPERVFPLVVFLSLIQVCSPCTYFQQATDVGVQLTLVMPLEHVPSCSCHGSHSTEETICQGDAK